MEDKHTKGPLILGATNMGPIPIFSMVNDYPRYVPGITLPDAGKELSEEQGSNILLFVKAYNSFDSAASRLGISAVQLAEALQDGGIAELYESLAEMYRVCNISKDDAPHRVRANASSPRSGRRGNDN